MFDRGTIALIIFCWFTANNGFAWLMFSPVTQDLITMYFPDMTTRQLEMLDAWQPFIYLIACYPMTLLQNSHNGLWKSVILGTSLETVGGGLKLLSSTMSHTPNGLVLLHIGQIFSALASPIAIGAPAYLSATWFSAEVRTRATAAGVLFNNVGNAICYILIPALTHAYGYQSVMKVEVISGVACLLAAVAFFPQTMTAEQILANNISPTTASEIVSPNSDGPRARSAADRMGLSVAKQLKLLVSHPSAIILCLVYAWTSGGQVAWTALFDEILGSRGFDDVFIGYLSFGSSICYVLGGLVSSLAADTLFPRKLKSFIVLFSLFNTISCVGFLWAIPSDHPGAAREGMQATTSRKVAIVVFGALCGLFNGSSAPLYYELLAEITYPVSEAVSGNIMSLGENAGALFMFQFIVRVFRPRLVNESFTAGMCIATVLATLVHEQYTRNAFEGSPVASRDELPHLNVGDDVAMTPLETNPLREVRKAFGTFAATPPPATLVK